MTWRGPWDALTEADRDALVPYLGTDMRVTDIAQELAWTTSKVYRVADKFGLSVRARSKHVIRNIASVVEDMRPLEAVEYLTEAYLNLTGEEPQREAQLVADYNLGPAQAKLLAVLEARAGEVVPYETLMTIFEQAGYGGDEPLFTGRVILAKARKKLRAAGLPVVIEAVRGMGYRLRYQEAA